MKAVWSGNISFGLVNIPVRLYTAAKSRTFSFKYLRKKDLCPIRYVRVCNHSGEKVPFNEIVKGFPLEKGQYAVLDQNDFRRADARRSQAIEIVEFVSSAEISPEYFEKPYFIEPQKDAEKAYALFREALSRSGKVAIANFVMKTKEHVAAIKPEGPFLILDQMRYHDELLSPSDLHIPRRIEMTDREIDMAEKLISEMTVPFRPREFRDRRSEELEKIITQKARGKLPEMKAAKAPKEKGAPDIMAQLKASLEQAKKRDK